MCAVLVSIQTYIASRQENPELEAALRMVEITNQQELMMVRMSEALRGYLLDPSNGNEFVRKKEADAEYLRLSAELQTLVGQNKAIQDLNRAMADFDATTLDEKENLVGTMVQKKDPGALDYYNQEYAKARGFQVENFLKMKELVRQHSNQTIQNSKTRTYYAGLMSIAALWIGMFVGLGLTAAVAFQISRRTGQVFGMINKVSDTVAQSSHSIQEESIELSEAVQRQSSAIQETAASVNEISAMIRKNTDSAMNSRHHSKVCREHAERGLQSFQALLSSVDEVRKSQQEIFKQVEKSHSGIAEINQIIHQIDEKTRVINDIVFQTKLLSFNASVEAARAGENGKGFAVVAEEVGNLARMSGMAAQEITKLLSQSSQRVSQIIDETRANVKGTIDQAATQLDSSISNVQQFEVNLTRMNEGVSQVDEKVDAISTASHEQEIAVTEISKVMHGLDADTQKSALIAHHSASRAKHLSEQAEQLESLVQRMTHLLHGEKGVQRNFKSHKARAQEPAPPLRIDDGTFEDDETLANKVA
jgi:methyl-accepting chemotaxis protein